MKVDSHTHSKFSPDGREEIQTMVNNALSNGAEYLAITDHCDKDVLQEGNNPPEPWSQLDLDAYYAEFLRVKQNNTNSLYLAFGIETGYDKRASKDYEKVIAKYPFDVIINSVHFVDGWDVYFPPFFEGRTKQKAYLSYLNNVFESLSAPYDFDIVGHIGYCVRNAPYQDPVMHYEENKEIIDKILKKVIALDKALEVNTHAKMAPNVEILQRYFELGGRKISFGSDAHRGDVLKDYDEVSKLLKEIGFTHFSIFKQRKEEKVEI